MNVCREVDRPVCPLVLPVCLHLHVCTCTCTCTYTWSLAVTGSAAWLCTQLARAGTCLLLNSTAFLGTVLPGAVFEFGVQLKHIRCVGLWRDRTAAVCRASVN